MRHSSSELRRIKGYVAGSGQHSSRILFSVFVKHAFRSADEGILLRTRSDGWFHMLNPACMPPNKNSKSALVRNIRNFKLSDTCSS